uniref:Uncharacterized protein n=1 Tax=Bactrocera latifrons TaxID=174628 RepID=A0A0K8VLM4_BACLA
MNRIHCESDKLKRLDWHIRHSHKTKIFHHQFIVVCGMQINGVATTIINQPIGTLQYAEDLCDCRRWKHHTKFWLESVANFTAKESIKSICGPDKSVLVRCV